MKKVSSNTAAVNGTKKTRSNAPKLSTYARANAKDAALFWTWLEQQLTRKGPIGDFARDSISDGGADCCKPAFYSERAVVKHLKAHDASDAAVLAGRAAWDAFYDGLVEQLASATRAMRGAK